MEHTWTVITIPSVAGDPENDLFVSTPTPWMAPEDGSEFSGWWFGDSVGGQQVWSRSVETGKGKVGSSETAGWLAGWPHSVGKPWKASAINLPSTVIVYSSTHKHGDLGDGLLLALLHWQKKRSIFRWGSNWPRAAEPKIRWGSSKSRLASPLGRRVCRWFVDRLGTRMPWRGWRSAPIFWCGKRVGMP